MYILINFEKELNDNNLLIRKTLSKSTNLL